MIAPPAKQRARWLLTLAWVGAAVALIAGADVLPPWATIALAAGLFAARVFLPHPDAACRPAERATSGTGPAR